MAYQKPACWKKQCSKENVQGVEYICSNWAREELREKVPWRRRRHCLCVSRRLGLRQTNTETGWKQQEPGSWGVLEGQVGWEQMAGNVVRASRAGL